MKLRAIDLYCGGGGTSCGVEQTGAVEVVCGVNHWQTAVDTFQANHPRALALCSRVDSLHPSNAPRCNFLFASPECTEHSYANTWELSEDSRCQPNDVSTWIDWHLPDAAVIENVPALLKWGPLNRHYRPIKSQRGRLFHSWLDHQKAHGYTADYRILNSADYGAATARLRLIVVLLRGRKRFRWPEPTHLATANRLPGMTAEPHRGFESVIDYSMECGLLDIRRKPLCPATLRKIAEGNNRYPGQMWILGYYGCATYTPVTRPLPTITTHERFALIDNRTRHTGYRMITNQEAAAAQGFPESYRLTGNKTEVTTQIGNSVPPALARAVTQSLLSV